ncbi:MAG TPA: ABC transporter substrate-binding protein [Dehalococcoidia bacterium]|nr:ABC transporter substrate-binding protein [Dehalococcoidia bacterium]
MRASRVVRAALALAGVAALLGGCDFAKQSSSSADTGTVAHVKLALDWTPNTNHTGIYVALQKGYYKDQGIDLTLLPYSSAVTPEQLVATGQAEFGISFTESVTAARAVGEPLVSVAAIFQHNTSALVSLKSSGLDTVAKLAGKRYAGFGAPYEQPVISQVLACGGASSTDFQNVTTDLDPVEALKSGKFDFAWIYMGVEGIQAQHEGLTLNTFPLVDYCIPDYYSPVIVTNQSFIQQHGDIIKRFLKATSEGYTYAAQHPTDAANLLMQAVPKGTFDDPGFVRDSQAYQSPRYIADAKCWGQQTLEKWTNYPRFMFNHHAIQDANGNPITHEPDYAAAFTDAFLPPC